MCNETRKKECIGSKKRRKAAELGDAKAALQHGGCHVSALIPRDDDQGMK
jgi:hypothetical protein